MAENAPTSTPSSLPPPLQSASGAPGQPQFDASQGNGQNPSHMPPPPLPPVVIPQNTNPIPTAITSPMSGNMMSPTNAGGYVRRAAPEPNKRALYVGGLDPRVTEDILKQIFETTGHVQSVKIIPDKNVGPAADGLFAPLAPRLQLTASLCPPSFPSLPTSSPSGPHLTFLRGSIFLRHPGPSTYHLRSCLIILFLLKNYHERRKKRRKIVSRSTCPVANFSCPISRPKG